MRKKIIWLIPTLEAGGAQKVLTTLLTHLNHERYVHHLVVFEKKGIFLNAVPPNIPVYELKRVKALYGFVWQILLIRFLRYLRKERPDLIISFMWYPNLIAIMARICTGINVIVSERLSVKGTEEGKLEEFIRKWVILLLYRKADKIITVSRQMECHLVSEARVPPCIVSTIYNPVDISRLQNLSMEEVTHEWFGEDMPAIVGVGRLAHQKGFGYLIKAVDILKRQGMKCRLVIIGEGPERKTLLNLVESLGVRDVVAFLGLQKNPYKYLAKATLFVLPSLYEGFPNILVEAMALGVPCIATCCPTGPEEIITEGVNGLLVSPASEKALAEAIMRLLKDPDLRKQLADAGKKRVEDFRVEKIVKEYENLILSV